MNVLFATSEAYPLIKTGGLADVSASLPRALLELKHDVRLLLPFYGSIRAQNPDTRLLASTQHYGHKINLLETRLPGTRVKVLLVDCPAAFAREGNPYLDADGVPWSDNAFRFMLFCQVAVDIALNRLGLDWPVDLVHCNDWQSAMVPALLQRFVERPATVFTIHNLAYQGVFHWQTYFNLGLPHEHWSTDGVEFHNQFSFMKGALNFADVINTVSVQYAREIQTEPFGCGLHGLLQKHSDRLSGIQNGIDTEVWNPGSDDLISSKYTIKSLDHKALNKSALQQELGLDGDLSLMLMGMVTRLVSQKGLDLLLDCQQEILQLPVQLVVLGSGDAIYEQELEQFAAANPQRVAFFKGYDEALSHRIEAGSDLYLMPSKFEPCGLNQLYSLRYGTLPLVTPVGGLIDAVTDAAQENADGFVMSEISASGLMESIRQALQVYQNPQHWKKLQITAMDQDHSWKHSALDYVELYRTALER